MSNQLDIFGEGPGCAIVGKRRLTPEEQFRALFGYDKENVCGNCQRFENEFCRIRGKSKVKAELVACSKFVSSK